MEDRRLRTSLADAAAGVADLVAGAVRGSDPIGLAEYVNSGVDTKVAMGAVRLVGADLFAPHLLLGRPVDTGDAAIIAGSFAVFPPGTGGEADTRERQLAAWRDWATGRMLFHANVETPTSRAAPTPAAGTVAMLLGRSPDWREWSANAAALCPLALPGMEGSIQEAVAEGTRPLAQGTTRAVLRQGCGSHWIRSCCSRSDPRRRPSPRCCSPTWRTAAKSATTTPTTATSHRAGACDSEPRSHSNTYITAVLHALTPDE